MTQTTLDPCPVCSGRRREADGTWTLRKPLWGYVTETLRLLASYPAGGTPDVLRVLADEIDAAVGGAK